VDRDLTDDELKYAAKSGWRDSQNNYILHVLKNSEFAINCVLTKAVIMSINKCIHWPVYLLSH